MGKMHIHNILEVRRSTLVVGFFMLFSGCSLTPLQKDFSCPYKEGEPCLSISQADQKSLNSLQSQLKDDPKRPVFTSYPDLPSDPHVPIREPEVVRRIWIAPFEDSDKNWHAASYVYTIAENSKWRPQGVTVHEALSKPIEAEAPEK